jgi:TRAP-type C4-dicarboxylate transport system permease small subunit
MAHDTTETAAPKGAVGWLAALVGRGFGIFAALAILAVLVLTTINVVGRYLFTAPLRGAEEMTGFLVVAMVMLGAAEAYRRGDHIRIDLLTERLGPSGARWVDILSHLAVAAFAANLLRTGLHTVEFSRNFEAYSAGYLQVPMWIPQSALVIGGALLLVMALLKLIESLLAFVRKEDRP